MARPTRAAAPRARAAARATEPRKDPRPPRRDASPSAAPRAASHRVPMLEPAKAAPIPNPLQQTYDKRPSSRRAVQRREIPEDGPIPNPLQQTYDKRALQQRERSRCARAPRTARSRTRCSRPTTSASEAAPARWRRFGGGSSAEAAGRQEGRRPREPDPLQTSVGYIGADAFLRKAAGGGGGGGAVAAAAPLVAVAAALRRCAVAVSARAAAGRLQPAATLPAK
jgi:23S rRNA pseudouridine2605 synthase